jgi:hypothetical protein
MLLPVAAEVVDLATTLVLKLSTASKDYLEQDS